jgi:hypothetical protein
MVDNGTEINIDREETVLSALDVIFILTSCSRI